MKMTEVESRRIYLGSLLNPSIPEGNELRDCEIALGMAGAAPKERAEAARRCEARDLARKTKGSEKKRILDSVDAGDSLGHLQRQKVPSPALIEGAPRERDGQQRAPHQRLDVRPDLVKAYLSNLIALHTLNESLALHTLNQNLSTGSESSAGWSDAARLETVQHALDRVWNTMSEDERRETERRLRAEG
jgi:hypothetical protein